MLTVWSSWKPNNAKNLSVNKVWEEESVRAQQKM